MFECLIDIMDTEETCAFDKLFKNNVPHITQKIFLCLDLESLKSCRKVSSEWNRLFMTKSFQQKAEYVFLEDAMRQNKKLLCGKIKVAQRTQGLKDLLEAIIWHMILFFLLGCSFLTNKYLNGEDKEACINKSRRCSEVLAYQSFNLIYIFVMLIMLICSNWSDLRGYQRKWAREWNNILKTEEYKSNVASLFHNDMRGQTKTSELTKFHKDILMREEEFRLKDIGRDTKLKMRVIGIVNILYIIICVVTFQLF